MLTALLLFSVLAVSIGAVSVNDVHALRCQIDIKQLQHPSSVSQAEKFNITTDLSVTCSTSMVDLAGRVDIVDPETNRTLSTSGFHLGYVSEPQKTFDITVLNEAEAPSADTDWTLKARVSLFAIATIIASADDSFDVRVGAGGTIVFWLPFLVVALVVIAVAVYFARIRRKGKSGK
jgi:hypothetical protein